MSLLNFDATAVAPANPLDPVPAGDYTVCIVDSEMKPTSSGNGYYLQLTLEVLEGEFSGRKIFDRLNLDNPNRQAVEIAQRTLSAICHAVGVLQVQDSAQLHDKPLVAKVAVRAARGEYGPSNEVKGYKASSAGVSAPPRVPAAAQAAAATAPAAAAASRPWAR